MNSLIENVLSRLKNVRQSGQKWTAYCPAHEDGRRSLSIAIGHKNQVLMFCFAGCSIQKIVGALGLTLRDLFPRN